MNAGESPGQSNDPVQEQASPVPSIEGKDDTLPDAPVEKESIARAVTNGADAHGDSEAETEIESPVKKREAKRQQQQQQNNSSTISHEKPHRSRIGSLPVPQDDDEEEPESTTSPAASYGMSDGKAMSSGDDAQHEEDTTMIDHRAMEDDSDDLSSPQSDDDVSKPPSRSHSERPQQAQNGPDGSPNPRKRKHRASSVSITSNKRQSMDPPKRTRLRDMHSEGAAVRSPSPRSRAHRRTVSTQSALNNHADGSRKRRSVPGIPGREIKSAKTWEESDGSSETASRGNLDESRRLQRGSSRWTSATPGRTGGREHKRHVNRYGFTRLAQACEEGNVELVKEWREKDPDQLELAEFAGNKPLQIAALNGNAEVVSYLIEQGCQIDCANVDKDTPLIDAAENGHLAVVKLLLDAGVDPLRQNQKGQQALDVVTDDTDDASEIRATLSAAIDRWNSSEAKQRREEEEEQRHRAGPSKELHFMARTYENLLRLVQNNDRNGVREFLAARVPVDNNVIAAAAKTGDQYLVNMLLADMTDKKARQKPETPMLAVLGTSHFDMVTALTQLDNFNPGWRSRNGKTWPELAESKAGPMWRQEKELLQKLYDQHMSRGGAERRSSSPVVKRDGGRRRPVQHDEDDSGSSSDEREDDARSSKFKRKNGRRLMSRRDMRAASGKGNLSDSSEDAEGDVEMDEGGNTAPTNDEPMKPPDSPNTRRKLRSKSISSPMQSSSALSPKHNILRRRSSSLRDMQDLPAAMEEDWDSAMHSSGALDEKQREDAKIKKERGAEVKIRLEEARRLEEKRSEEEATAAEVRKAEEAARQAEEQKKADEQRKADELREQEEAEQARKAEAERAEKERQLQEAKKAYVAEVLAALPAPLAHFFDQNAASIVRSDRDMAELAFHLQNLKVLATRRDKISDAWLLNLQAAPLLGPAGLELLFQPSKPGCEASLSATWTTEPLESSDWRIVDQLLSQMPYIASIRDDTDLSFAEENSRAAQRYNAYLRAKALLRKDDCPILLQRVRVQDVRNHLDRSLPSSFDVRGVAIADHESPSVGRSFVSCMQCFWGAENDVHRALESKVDEMENCVRYTSVAVVHEK